MIRFELPGVARHLISLPDGWIPCIPPSGLAFLATEPNATHPPIFNVAVESWVGGAEFDADMYVRSLPSGALLLHETDGFGEWHLLTSHLIGDQPAIAEQRSYRIDDLRVTLTVTLHAHEFASSAAAVEQLLRRPTQIDEIKL